MVSLSVTCLSAVQTVISLQTTFLLRSASMSHRTEMSNGTAQSQLLFISCGVAAKCLTLLANQYAISHAWRASAVVTASWRITRYKVDKDRASGNSIQTNTLHNLRATEVLAYITQTTLFFSGPTETTGGGVGIHLTHMLVLAVDVSHSPARPMMSSPEES